MGQLATKLCDGEEKLSKIIILGLDDAGKTTILYRLKRTDVGPTTPTVGFNVETVTVSNGVTFSVWDVGGQLQLRPLWRHYYGGVEGLIYVVDSSDVKRIAEARDELFRILESPDMSDGCPVLVIANKNDKSNALTLSEVIDAMDLSSVRNREWYVQSACAPTGVGLFEAMTELGRLVSDYKRQKNERILEHVLDMLSNYRRILSGQTPTNLCDRFRHNPTHLNCNNHTSPCDRYPYFASIHF